MCYNRGSNEKGGAFVKYTLVPDRHFSRYLDLTPSVLQEDGIRALLLDIDNTLAPYEQPEPDDALRAWLASLSAAGIGVAFVSNNDDARVELFNRTLGLPAYPHAKKPLKSGVRRALAALGATPAETALMGDQIFTDVGAVRASRLARAYTVPPIRDKRDLFTRLKRLCERPIYRAYRRREETRRKEQK